MRKEYSTEMGLQIAEYEIESIEIISEMFSNNINSQELLTIYNYIYDGIISTVKIKFKTGEIIETYLHEKECKATTFVGLKNDLNICKGNYNFTGNMTEYGWENKCSLCESRVYGPIIICRKELKKQIDDYNNQAKNNSP